MMIDQAWSIQSYFSFRQMLDIENTYNIIKALSIHIKSIELIIFEMNVQDNSLASFVTRTELLFAVPVPEILRFILGYCQSLVLLDFGLKQKQVQCKKEYGKRLSSELVSSLKRMTPIERASFYTQITESIFRLIHGDLQPPPIEQHFEKKECFFKKSSHKSWNKCSIEHNHKNQFLLVTDLRTSKSDPKYYINLTQYLLRRSKSKDYFAFSLDACDKRVNKELRNIKIGFEHEAQFKKVFSAIRESINYRQWFKVVQFYESDPLTKNCISSIREIRGNQFMGSEQVFSEKDDDEAFYTCCQISDDEFKPNNINNDEEFQDFQELYTNSLESEASQSPNLHFEIWNSFQKLKQMNQPNIWSTMIQNDQFELCKASNGSLRLHINLKHKFELVQLYRSLYSKPVVDKLTKISEDSLIIYGNKFSEQDQPRVFQVKREIVNFENELITLHQYSAQLGMGSAKDGYICGEYQAIWVIKANQSVSTISILLDIDNKGHLTKQQNLKMNISYLKGIFQGFMSLPPNSHPNNRKISFFNKSSMTICPQRDQIQIPKIAKDIKYSMSPLAKGLHDKIANKKAQTILSTDWKRDDDKGGLEYINAQKITAQKGVVKHILSQIGKNLFSGKSILNISLPVEIFSAESHLERLLHSLRLAPSLFQVSAHLQKENISDEQLSVILKLSAAFGISMSLLYLSQEKAFNPILGETSQLWIDGCPAYAQQISHHPPISAIYFVGRGYRIYGQLEARVELGMNSGKGSNDGEVTVQFQNGITVRNYFAAGEVSGLSYGKRKFSMTGKSHHFIDSHRLYLEVDFSSKTQEIIGKNQNQKQLKDHAVAKLYTIPNSQIGQFKKTRKFKNPSQFRMIDENKDQRFNGRWTSQIMAGTKSLLNIGSQELGLMDYEHHPLPSDCIWREDVFYRASQNFPQAQKHKVKLEERQRKDKKDRKDRRSQCEPVN